MPLNRLTDSGVPLLPMDPDMQRTSLSIDGLARFTCNTWDEILAAQAGGELFPARLWEAKVVHPRASGRATFWNRCEITLQGASIEVRVNGLLVSKGQFPSLLTAAALSQGKTKREEGFIGLQCHTEVVQFRNIRINEL